MDEVSHGCGRNPYQHWRPCTYWQQYVPPREPRRRSAVSRPTPCALQRGTHRREFSSYRSRRYESSGLGHHGRNETWDTACSCSTCSTYLVDAPCLRREGFETRAKLDPLHRLSQ